MPELHPFQVLGRDFLLDRRRALLADQMRLGKAVQALHAARGQVLIGMPAMVLEAGGWQDEITKWFDDLQIESVTFASYSSLSERTTTLGRTGRKVSKTTGSLRADLRRRWDTVIWDEGHRLKNRQADQTEAALQVDTDRMYWLTGTAAPNGWGYELFTALRAIFPGDPRFRSYWNWVREWFLISKNRFNLRALEVGGLRSGVTWERFMSENFGDRYLRRTWETAGLPGGVFVEQVLWAGMTPVQARAYKELKKDYRTFVETTGEEVVAWSAGERHAKLAQLVSVSSEGETGKVQLLRELLEAMPGQPVCIFCQFRNSALAVAQVAMTLGRAPAVVMGGVAGRGQLVRDFQAGRVDTLIGTIETITENLELWRSNCAIFFEQSWTPSKNDQAKARLAFIGKVTPISVIYLVTKESLDQRMYHVVQTKTDQQVKMLTAGQFLSML